MPLFEVQPVEWDVPEVDAYDALLITSGNAVRQAGDGLAALVGLTVFAVGSASARAAKNAGLSVVATGEGGVDDVLSLANSAGHRRLLWLAGEDRVAASLPDGMMVDIRVVYRSATLPPPDNFSQCVGAADAVLVHSPRAAQYFGNICDSQDIDRATIKLAALSPAIAESGGTGWKSVVVASMPNDDMLLAQL